jgi:hypothetical protein
LVKGDTMGEYLHPRIKLETLGAFMCIMVTSASTKRWTLTLPKFDEPFGARFHFENFWEPSSVDVRVILLVEDDKTIYIPIESETLGVFMCMYMTVTDASTRR